MPKFAHMKSQPNNAKPALAFSALLAIAHLAFSVVGCSDSNAITKATSDSGAGTEVISDSGASTEAAEKERALDLFIEGVTGNVGMPGVQTAVIKDGRVVWAKSYGMAVIAPLPDRPMTNDTISEFAQISNEVIAVAFMQQVEAGAFGLDDDINAALPWSIRNPSYPDDPITWRMIFSHTASFNNVTASIDGPIVYGMDSPVALGDFLRNVYSPTGQYYGTYTFRSTRPGQTYWVSQLAPGLAAYAIELKVNQPFYTYVKEHIFDPLDMQSTSYFMRDLPTDLLAVGYTCYPRGDGFGCDPLGTPGGTSLEQQNSFPYYPVSLLRTSAVQYLKFMAMIMNGGSAGSTSILSAAGVEQLLTPLPMQTDDGRQQGLYFRSVPGYEGPGGSAAWGNGAQLSGVSAAAFFDRSAGVGAIAVGNSTGNGDRMTQIVSRLLSEFR